MGVVHASPTTSAAGAMLVICRIAGQPHANSDESDGKSESDCGETEITVARTRGEHTVFYEDSSGGCAGCDIIEHRSGLDRRKRMFRRL